MRKLALVLGVILSSSLFAATTRNDDSCDITVLPAATLLLPYFEVDLDDRDAETTLVSITNVTNADAIARVTLWTDRAYPVFTFNLYLTGYDVQSIDLYDVIARGAIPETGTDVTGRGELSVPDARIDLGTCTRLPVALDVPALERLQSALTAGDGPDGCREIGGEHDNAVGYATIDVVGNCSSLTPLDAAYWSGDLRYDNVLIGDFQQIGIRDDRATGGPLVHIRAIPEGGTRRERKGSADAGFPRTFYARYQSPLTPKLDARQPLPSQFAVRWIQGGPDRYETSLKIWREGRAGIDARCADYAAETKLAVHEIVTFDEDENAVGSDDRHLLPATSLTSVADAATYPQMENGAQGGWMYVNLDRSPRDEYASQAWVISSMRAGGRFAADSDAVALGNGCSPPAARSEITVANAAPIAPAPNESSSDGVASTGNDDSCDVALLPAATLLLPYFAVDFEDPNGETTLFTITNVTPKDQIARVTLWTDYAYPTITFNVHLTGYDVQGINLYDVIARGVIAAGDRTDRGAYSHRNGAVDLADCTRLPERLPEAYVVRMQSAFAEGSVPAHGDREGCNNVGDVHDDAVGYATIDVVRNCAMNDPTSEAYWTEDLAYENVLIGDFQQVHSADQRATGSPLVHIRAIPEGGTPAERRALPRKFDARFPRTFHAAHQPASAPRLDSRQPLPSVFAARWASDRSGSRETFMKIWREGPRGRTATCATYDDNVPELVEIVRFDDRENAWAVVDWWHPPGVSGELRLPATSLTHIDDSSIFPQADNGATEGWVYFNLDTPGDGATSTWVVASLRARGRSAIDFDAAALGNGCSLPAERSRASEGAGIIGPRP